MATSAAHGTAALTDEQQRAVDHVKNGNNLFLTGAAGTGKSRVVHAIKSALRAKFGAAFLKRVATVGSTGTSALGVGGTTLHALAGCGVPSRAGDMQKCWSKRKQWRDVDVLIIDEISMVQAEFLDLLDQTVREIRHSPIPTPAQAQAQAPAPLLRRTFWHPTTHTWCTAAARECVLAVLVAELRSDRQPAPGVLPSLARELWLRILEFVPQRQLGWPAFGGIQLVVCGDFFQLPPVPGRADMGTAAVAAAVDDVPVCTFNQFDACAFRSRCWDDARFKNVELTQVFRQSDREFVDNLMMVRQGNVAMAGAANERVADYFRGLGRALPDSADGIKPTRLSPTVDARAKNASELRALGTPSRFFEANDSCVPLSDRELHPLHGADARETLMEDTFFTADTVLREVELKVDAQVMLVKNLHERPASGDGGCAASHDELVNGSRGRVVTFEAETGHPVVRFKNGREVTIKPEKFEKEVCGVGTCVREQIPLVLAWVLRIHKSQGLSLDAVVVDLNGCFAHGLAYVALSRARSREGLQVVNFDPRRVHASEDVKDFCRRVFSQGDSDGGAPVALGKWWEPTLGDPRHAAWRARLVAGDTTFARVVNS